VGHLVDEAADGLGLALGAVAGHPDVVLARGHPQCDELLGHGRCRHRRLLGGHRPVQQVHDQEADGVVHASAEAGPERRQPQRQDGELGKGGAADDGATAQRGAQHGAVFVAVAGDVVLAGLGMALGHLACHQRVLPPQQRAQAAPLLGQLHQAHQQALQFALRLVGQQQVEHRFQPVAAGGQLLDLEDDVHRDAVRLQVVGDAGGGRPAALQQRAQVGGLLRGGGLVAGRPAHRRGPRSPAPAARTAGRPAARAPCAGAAPG
jgi:hypothetical protein